MNNTAKFDYEYKKPEYQGFNQKYKELYPDGYRVIALSFWAHPQVYLCSSEEDMKELVYSLKSQQYSVEIEKLEGV